MAPTQAMGEMDDRWTWQGSVNTPGFVVTGLALAGRGRQIVQPEPRFCRSTSRPSPQSVASDTCACAGMPADAAHLRHYRLASARTHKLVHIMKAVHLHLRRRQFASCQELMHDLYVTLNGDPSNSSIGTTALDAWAAAPGATPQPRRQAEGNELTKLPS